MGSIGSLNNANSLNDIPLSTISSLDHDPIVSKISNDREYGLKTTIHQEGHSMDK